MLRIRIMYASARHAADWRAMRRAAPNARTIPDAR
jgi:hypothetical protein